MAVAILFVVTGGIVAFRSITVCDQQLSSNGTAVKVCRHLQASDPPVIAVGLRVLAGLGVFFTEISGFGVTLKREVRKATESAEKATESAEEAKELASTNKDTIHEAAGDLADLGRRVFDEERQNASPRTTAAEEQQSELHTLAEEYNTIRLTMPSGSARTEAMTDVVNKMISALKDARDFDVARSLSSVNRGLRLAGFAHLYAYPDPRWTSDLVSSLTEKEDKPFGQYWALRALRKQCETDRSALNPQMTQTLANYSKGLPGRSDRAIELRRVLEECGA